MLSSAHLPDRLRTLLLKMEITGDPTYAPGEMVYSMLDDLFLDLDNVIYEFLKSLGNRSQHQMYDNFSAGVIFWWI